MSEQQQVKIDSEEMSESLSGFEEIGIKQAFGVSVDALEGTMPARALLWVEKRRTHPTDAGTFDARAAYDEVMSMSMRAVDDRFEDDTDREARDLLSAEGSGPVSESGEGDGLPE